MRSIVCSVSRWAPTITSQMQLLTLTRIDSGVDSNLRETFDLANLVQEVVADGDFEAHAQNRFVRFVANDSCAITGVAELMRSAVENVIRNAVRHTAPGTAVEVTIERQNKSILLRVRDHGPGVPDAMLQDIFLPFHRVDAGTNGSGLGSLLPTASCECTTAQSRLTTHVKADS